jgi:hypothetical protein
MLILMKLLAASGPVAQVTVFELRWLPMIGGAIVAIARQSAGLRPSRIRRIAQNQGADDAYRTPYRKTVADMSRL